MRTLKWLVSLLILSLSGNMSATTASLCGKIKLQSPFKVLSNSSTSSSSWLSNMILCRSEKLYFRTSIGLFPISSIDYAVKTLTVLASNPASCSESSTFISPALLYAGFPSQLNSLLLFNCRNLNQAQPFSYPIQNCSGSHSCKEKEKDTYPREGHSCLLVQDIEKLRKGFHPGDLNCSHYTIFHSYEERSKKYNVGMKVSFEIDHKPDLCEECRRPNGRCGVGLKCFCHLEQCVDKVVSGSTGIRNQWHILNSILFVTGVLVGFLVHNM